LTVSTFCSAACSEKFNNTTRYCYRQFPHIFAAGEFAEHGQAMDLHTAARNGDVARMLELIGLGTDLNSRDKHSRTALHMAAWAGQDVSRDAAAATFCCCSAAKAAAATSMLCIQHILILLYLD
jgi:ankyrin repeat protein